MSAKKKSRAPKPTGSAAKSPARPSQPVEPATTLNANTGLTEIARAAPPDTPRRRLVRNLVFAAVCIYIAMLYLLALDQQFDWGIFGP